LSKQKERVTVSSNLPKKVRLKILSVFSQAEKKNKTADNNINDLNGPLPALTGSPCGVFCPFKKSPTKQGDFYKYYLF